MTIDKTLLSGSTATLILKLLDGQDMYGYQIIEELARRSDNTFQLKAGTLYPLLHGLEKKGLLESYEDNADRPCSSFRMQQADHEPYRSRRS